MSNDSNVHDDDKACNYSTINTAVYPCLALCWWVRVPDLICTFGAEYCKTISIMRKPEKINNSSGLKAIHKKLISELMDINKYLNKYIHT